MADAVNHPRHYTMLPHEVIEVVGDLDFCTGNALKYLMRAPYKHHTREDLQKALWYVTYAFKHHRPLPRIPAIVMEKGYENAIAMKGWTYITCAILNLLSGNRGQAMQNIGKEISKLEGAEHGAD